MTQLNQDTKHDTEAEPWGGPNPCSKCYQNPAMYDNGKCKCDCHAPKNQDTEPELPSKPFDANKFMTQLKKVKAMLDTQPEWQKRFYEEFTFVSASGRRDLLGIWPVSMTDLMDEDKVITLLKDFILQEIDAAYKRGARDVVAKIPDFREYGTNDKPFQTDIALTSRLDLRGLKEELTNEFL